MNEYRIVDHKKMRCGYTTGSCAAAAAKAAARMLFTGNAVREISLDTPSGIRLTLPVEDALVSDTQASCAVRKDAGDDPDVTDGILIYAAVSGKKEPGICIDGGEGIGTVTKPGLEQPVGQAAINHVPRAMIEENALAEMTRAGYSGGIRILIYAPEGAAVAGKTFNPNLGIKGGISILGTTGIVEPMSEAALVGTIRVEMRQKHAECPELLLLAPGNYSLDYMQRQYGLRREQFVKCSNFIGEALDYALDLNFGAVVLTGHVGKMVKLGAGIMNTHSGMADARMEVLCACCIRAGGSAGTARRILECTTTEGALARLKAEGILNDTMKVLRDRILYHLNRHLNNRMRIEVLVYSNEYGMLTKTDGLDELIRKRNH